MLSGPRRAVSGLNHAEKHRGPQTAEWIAAEAEAEADKTKANSSLIMRDIRKLLLPSTTLAAGSHNECKHRGDQRVESQAHNRIL